ncbi:MAG: nucleotidyltransferase domain-containing protein [Clostridiales bacterium]|jgi:predicted nucleotidyltransferase|nr:nucleotidyltransferase domain-containing protein [Clostridiales bacterium]
MIYSIDELSKRIAPVVKKYNLRAVYLFGSYARNEATEDSDVDVLVDRAGSIVRTAFDMGELYNDLRDSIGKEIDLVTTQALEQDSTRERTPWFMENVMKERVSIYE